MQWDSSLIKQEPSILCNNVDSNNQFQSIESMIGSFVSSVDGLSSIEPSPIKQRRIISPLKHISRLISHSSSSLITFDRDPAVTETTDHLTDELRWLLIQYGPYQPRGDEDQFLASAIITNNGKGNIRFRSKWFDDIRFSGWLEYSLSTGRAYCFYCRLFAESNRNRAFSRDGIRNWRKCLGSRGQKKRRSTGATLKPIDDFVACQKRGSLESHAMTEAHKLSYRKYLAFINQMHFEEQTIENNIDTVQSGSSIIPETNLLENIKQENDM